MTHTIQKNRNKLRTLANYSLLSSTCHPNQAQSRSQRDVSDRCNFSPQPSLFFFFFSDGVLCHLMSGLPESHSQLALRSSTTREPPPPTAQNMRLHPWMAREGSEDTAERDDSEMLRSTSNSGVALMSNNQIKDFRWVVADASFGQHVALLVFAGRTCLMEIEVSKLILSTRQSSVPQVWASPYMHRLVNISPIVRTPLMEVEWSAFYPLK